MCVCVRERERMQNSLENGNQYTHLYASERSAGDVLDRICPGTRERERERERERCALGIEKVTDTASRDFACSGVICRGSVSGFGITRGIGAV